MSEGMSLILNKYMSRLRYGVIILSLFYTDRADVEYNYWLFHMHKME